MDLKVIRQTLLEKNTILVTCNRVLVKPDRQIPGQRHVALVNRLILCLISEFQRRRGEALWVGFPAIRGISEKIFICEEILISRCAKRIKGRRPRLAALHYNVAVE